MVSPTMTEGILIFRSVPPAEKASSPRLFTMMTATAPAVCAFRTLSVKLQVPRSTSAIFPDRETRLFSHPSGRSPVVHYDERRVGSWIGARACPKEEA